MWISRTVEDVRAQRTRLTGRVALVPTMGALHDGHLSLISRAKESADHVIVSIFVNPTQFGPAEDYRRYPKPFDRDLDLCRQLDVSGIFNPTVEQIYPLDQAEYQVEVPALATPLEGRFRPGHFPGVCRIVAKLFDMIAPDCALFGQKDFQQLRVIQAMVADLAMPVEIVECPTMRESDGLAISSRNIYLDQSQRKRASAIFEGLNLAKRMVRQSGETNPKAIEDAMVKLLVQSDVVPDYAAIRDPLTLGEIEQVVSNPPDGPTAAIALVAAHVDHVRLIDNLAL